MMIVTDGGGAERFCSSSVIQWIISGACALYNRDRVLNHFFLDLT